MPPSYPAQEKCSTAWPTSIPYMTDTDKSVIESMQSNEDALVENKMKLSKAISPASCTTLTDVPLAPLYHRTLCYRKQRRLRCKAMRPMHCTPIHIQLSKLKRKKLLMKTAAMWADRREAPGVKDASGSLRTFSPLGSLPKVLHPQALMAQCPQAASDCAPLGRDPPVGSSALCSTEQFTPPLALALPSPTLPGHNKLGTQVTIHGKARNHTTQLVQTPKTTTEPCHSEQEPRSRSVTSATVPGPSSQGGLGEEGALVGTTTPSGPSPPRGTGQPSVRQQDPRSPSSVTKEPNTPLKYKAVHGVTSPQPNSWLYCEVCQYRTNNTKPGKARRRFLNHMRLQHGVPRQVVQEQVPVKSHLLLDTPIHAPESRLARSQTVTSDTSGIADMDQPPALLLQILSEDHTAVLCSSPQPVPCSEVKMNIPRLGPLSRDIGMGDKQKSAQPCQQQVSAVPSKQHLSAQTSKQQL